MSGPSPVIIAANSLSDSTLGFLSIMTNPPFFALFFIHLYFVQPGATLLPNKLNNKWTVASFTCITPDRKIVPWSVVHLQKYSQNKKERGAKWKR
jgi:hypothetical protein